MLIIETDGVNYFLPNDDVSQPQLVPWLVDIDTRPCDLDHRLNLNVSVRWLWTSLLFPIN